MDFYPAHEIFKIISQNVAIRKGQCSKTRAMLVLTLKKFHSGFAVGHRCQTALTLGIS